MIELAILKAIEEGHPKWLLSLLWVFSKIFQLGVYLKNFAYDYGFLKAKKAKVPVISIGNIKAGGTGKTPFCIHLATDLSKHLRCAVLYRGYRKDKHSGLSDEASLLQQKVPKAAVYIGKNRAQLAENVKEDVILLDDGMQHRKLFRDKEVVCMEASDLFGKGYYLPRGLLRDDPRRLEKADLIVVSAENRDEFDTARVALKKYTEAPTIGVKKNLVGWKNQEGHFYEELPCKKVAYFCAIGNPRSFEKTLLECNCLIVDKWVLKDHASFNREQLKKFYENAQIRGAEALVCTEKDFVKLQKCDAPIFTAIIDLDIVFNCDNYIKFINYFLFG